MGRLHRPCEVFVNETRTWSSLIYVMHLRAVTLWNAAWDKMAMMLSFASELRVNVASWQPERLTRSLRDLASSSVKGLSLISMSAKHGSVKQSKMLEKRSGRSQTRLSRRCKVMG